MTESNENKSKLKVASLGDSAFLIARPTEEGVLQIVYRSPQQDKAFGTPYQIGHHETSDHLSDALLASVPVFHGDIIILGTDGLWDNLFDEEIIETIKDLAQFVPLPSNKVKQNTLIDPKLPFWSGNATNIANAIGKRAFGQSMSKSANTPFSSAASEEFNIIYRGGKKDDVTVLVGFIEADQHTN